MSVDLHTHTTHSDGTFTPTELIRLAYEKNLTAIAITDHDITSG
ncbi:MAG: PHP domain-containing protein, partial [Calditrichia bacterium]|nr:PHP domain-containing protein [Calditrichia bacterium]